MNIPDHTFRVDDPDLEGQCEWCGDYILMGDLAHEDGDGAVFCSARCLCRAVLCELLADQEGGSDES